MNMPGFTAGASLYQTSGRYRVSNGGLFKGAPTQRVVLADIIGVDDVACSNCYGKCADNLGICYGIAVAAVPICLPCTGAAFAECNTQSYACTAFCNLPGQSCCPEFCYPGKCCGRGETCVDDNDPNSRYGCCPSNQNVCGGSCCAKGDTCCGDECCPAGHFCLDGKTCSQYGIFVTTPPPPPPPPPPICLNPDYEPCQVSPDHWVCCPPGQECCGPRGCRPKGFCVS